ncbi:MAG: S8 family serine peptidase [Blastocatellia bacterium]|nr:S8 family serine peptidase [Blastocatellia bacterium]
MRRSPLFHIVAGLMVVMVAFWSGMIRRWEIQRRAIQKTVCHRSTDDQLQSETTPKVAYNRPDSELGFIVKFKSGASKSAISLLLERLGAHEITTYKHLPGFSFESVSSSESVNDILAKYKADPNVEFVEPNFVYHTDDIWPNDPGFNEQWGHYNTGQPINGGTGGKSGVDIGAVAAWNITTGSEDVVVGVIDTGIDYTHTDLAANMWVNEKEIPDNGIDDDGNGVVDDVFGYNAIDDSGDPMDDNRHGTHCAGIIGAVGDNDEGVTGVNWKVKLMALKFLSGSGGGQLNDALECINYALEMKARGVNLRVLSNSWGGGGYSKALEEAIKDANEAGILFVAAAGNDNANNDRDPHYPSNYDVPNVISVAALDRNDKLASFSNFGEKTVHIAAPGVDVYSTVLDGEYEHLSGTSMATPYVSGVAALVLAKEPKLKVTKLKEQILGSAVPVEALKGKTATGGRLNAERALK